MTEVQKFRSLSKLQETVKDREAGLPPAVHGVPKSHAEQQQVGDRGDWDLQGGTAASGSVSISRRCTLGAPAGTGLSAQVGCS